MRGERTTERNLILPALIVLFNNGGSNHIVKTKILTKKLRERINPTPKDQKMLKGRNDDRLSQVIRNLISHRTLEKQGLASYKIDEANKEKGYQLTEKGIVTLRQHGIGNEQNEIKLGQLRLPFEDF